MREQNGRDRGMTERDIYCSSSLIFLSPQIQYYVISFVAQIKGLAVGNSFNWLHILLISPCRSALLFLSSQHLAYLVKILPRPKFSHVTT